MAMRCSGPFELVPGLAHALSEVEDEVHQNLGICGAKCGKGGVTVREDICYGPKRLSLKKNPN